MELFGPPEIPDGSLVVHVEQLRITALNLFYTAAVKQMDSSSFIISNYFTLQEHVFVKVSTAVTRAVSTALHSLQFGGPTLSHGAQNSVPSPRFFQLNPPNKFITPQFEVWNTRN